MNRTHSIIICMLMICVSSTAWTSPYVGTSPTPINNVELKYDLSTQILHIEANHVTSRPTKNFVRKVVIIKNSEDTQTFTFSVQSMPSKFIEDLNYNAAPGDHLDVELWGSLGAKGQASIDIPKPDTQEND